MFISVSSINIVIHKQYRNILIVLYTTHLFYPTIEIIMAIKKNTTTIVIISKSGTLSEVAVEPPSSETTLEELTVLLSKKCGYRNPDGFSCYHTYKYKNKKKFSFSNGTDDELIPKIIYVDVWAKTDGRAGNENKYEMPPPVDEIIYYGNIALVARVNKEDAVNLTVDIWNVIYECLFGGFEDLATTAVEDENEIDELDLVPAHQKTTNGYLKDGFVVDDDSDERPGRRSRKSKTSGGRKNKSESTESEFVTETDTESGTPPSESPGDSDAEAEPEPEVEADAEADMSGKTIVETKVKAPKKKSTITKKQVPSAKPKKITKKVEEPPADQESENELSEEEYL